MPDEASEQGASRRSDGKIFVDPYGWVTPVRDRNNQVLYYIDSTGSRVGDPLAGPGRGERVSATEAQRRANERKERQDTAPERAAADRLAASQTNQFAWVDGKRARIVSVNPDGSVNISYDGGEAQKYAPPTAFDALDSASIEPSTQFVMSNGTWRGADGTTTRTTKPGGFTTADAADRTFGNQVGQNRMTIESGVAWLANLSVKDPAAYDEMIDKLRGAGYLSDAEAQAARGGFSTTVAGAFAVAARDVAVVNGQPDGANITLAQFLDRKSGANQDAEAEAYVPVDRTFTDPAALAATARSAAQTLLGRSLSAAEEQQFLGHFRGLENGVFDQMDAAGRAKGSATVTTPSAGGQAEAFTRDPKFDAERGQQLIGSYVDSLSRLLMGS